MRPSPGLRFPRIRLREQQQVCWQCSLRLGLAQASRPQPAARRALSNGSIARAAIPISASPRLKAGYFLSNGLLDRFNASPGAATSRKSVASVTPSEKTSSEADAEPSRPTSTADLPHRRRQAAKRQAAQAALSQQSRSATDQSVLPENASTILTDNAAAQPARSLRRVFSALLSLSKPRLTVLVVLTAMAPYALYPVPSFLSGAALAEAPSLSPLTLLFLTTGTALCSASANALNMLYEPATDAKMSRTRNRPLVRKLISKRTALLFAAFAAVAGTGALYLGVNPTVSFLGAANIVLYAGVYTPMKQLSWLNTWVGALIGGIPPLMGWAAAAGESATGDGTFRELLFAADGSSVGGWLFASLLFAWQFPHFMALSWPIREEYKAAGLRMLCWVNPARNARVALRYSLAFVPICLGLCAAGVTEWSFAVTSMPVNLWLVREAVRMWRLEGHGGSARGLFWASVWHLPAVMVLALLQKKGMWGRVWRSVMGEPEEDEDEWEDDDESLVVIPSPPPGPSELPAR